MKYLFKSIFFFLFLLCVGVLSVFAADEYYDLYAKVNNLTGELIEDVNIAYRLNNGNWNYLECEDWVQQDSISKHRGNEYNFFDDDFIRIPYRESIKAIFEFRFYKSGYELNFKKIIMDDHSFRSDRELFINVELWPKDY